MKSEFSVHRADRGTQLSHRSLSAKINSSSPFTKLSIHMTGKCIVSKVNRRLKPSHLRYQPTRIAQPFQTQAKTFQTWRAEFKSFVRVGLERITWYVKLMIKRRGDRKSFVMLSRKHMNKS